ncbi:unnamed protein product, partial [Ixodes hexagonus]
RALHVSWLLASMQEMLELLRWLSYYSSSSRGAHIGT